MCMYLSPFCHYFWSSCRLQVLEVAVSNPNYSYYHTEYCDTKYWMNKLRNVFCDISWSLANCLMKQMCLLSVNDRHTCNVHLIHFTISHLCTMCC